MTSPPVPPPPASLRQFILKVHSRCNLDCDYCYVYHSADTSWQAKPQVMDLVVAEQVGRRVVEHAVAHRLSEVRVVLHGGEPLLLGARRLGELLGVFGRGPAEAGVPVRLSVQTNGVLLTPDILDVLRRHRVGVSVSLDGTRAGHDRHRRFPKGRGSHGRVAQGLARLGTPEYRHLYAGLLCTIDLANDPVETYEALLASHPPRIDLLLPHGTWETPPPGLADRRGRIPTVPPLAARDAPAPTAATPYADWLRPVFDRWYDAPVRETGIRLFEELMAGVLGGSMRTESAGLAPATLAVVETDGSIEQSDSLKVAYEGAPETGLDVFRHSFDDVLDEPLVRQRQSGAAGLGPTCGRCPLVTVCGGGLFAHRYAPGSGFRNPSVYCADLAALILHIRARVRADLAGTPLGLPELDVRGT
ncbi:MULTISPECIES: FxsB family cyclophane-forming radical SAM/SPASM peptide maturase [unclassified Streptomyces]|uniref:FxsB family cyclophane-forming radical SAM/SPASM peptide maturase n=1 Tax=unclassified Streptomyces TaxID=2593676 RepID=UPI002E7A91D3|nr:MULTISPECIES: FxsB family cyclophane-forming radical SAM/SPASM peptide maturase [unclassified Streptomyces]MEE1762132.1 FxsB family radical SAM/SPASM domain protein [Streptomyces sp. SP18BB07]MEE1837803.1 FxsB family radical SAM/SPASM domain protein [Streptomyces sp. SP17KL33]